MFASWGNKKFEVNSKTVYTFDKISRTASYNVEEKTNGKHKPKLRNKNPALEDMSFSINLNARFMKTSIESDIESWKELMGKSYYFLIGNKAYGKHKWELISINITEQKASKAGAIISAKLEISMKEKPSHSYTSKKKSNAKSTRNSKSKSLKKAKSK